MRTTLKTLLAMSVFFMALTTFAQDGDQEPLVSHLSFKQNTLLLQATFPAQPVVGEESVLILEAKDVEADEVTEINDQVTVVLWMPSMGHGSSPTQVERAVDADGNPVVGTFNVRNVNFIMAGEWEVRVTLTDANGKKETKGFKITLGGNGHGGH